MAQEALQKVAAEMGVGIKVETNGASGVGNQLTAEDIRKAKLLSSQQTRQLKWIVSMANH